MKKNYFISFIIFLFVFIVGVNYVNAETKTISMGIKSNKTEFEPGDTVELDLVVACVLEGGSRGNLSTGFEYDPKVFGEVDSKSVEVRNGWETNNINYSNGMYTVDVFTKSTKNNITDKDASTDCNDGTYAKLLSGYKLKVKDVENQKTTIWVLNGQERVSSIEISIFKEDDNNNLKSLEVEDVNLEPEFNSKDTTYEAKVPYDKTSVNIKAECESDKCTVSNTGIKNLEVGENRFEIIAVAEDGSKKTYNLYINREEASKEASLSKLKIKDSNGKVLAIGFKSSKLNYNVDVDNDVLFVEFETACEGTNCEVEEVKTKKLEVGENIVSIKVKAEDGSTNVYKVTINRKKDNTAIYIIIGVIVLGGVGTGTYLIIKNKKKTKKPKLIENKKSNVEEIVQDDFDVNNLE